MKKNLNGIPFHSLLFEKKKAGFQAHFQLCIPMEAGNSFRTKCHYLGKNTAKQIGEF